MAIRASLLRTLAWLAASTSAGAQTPELTIQPLGTGIPTGLTLDGPRHQGPAAPIYINGQLSELAALAALNPNDILAIEALKPATAALLFPAAAGVRVLFIPTRQHAADPAVAALNWRMTELQQSSQPFVVSPPARSGQEVRLRSPDIFPRPRLYVDDQLTDWTTLETIKPNDIASLYILKGVAAASLHPQAAGRGVVSIVTKRNAHKRRVKKFEQHLRQLEADNPDTPASIEYYNALQPADVRYYLNGHLSSLAAVRAAFQRIVRAEALRGPQAAAYAHDSQITEVFLVETTP